MVYVCVCEAGSGQRGECAVGTDGGRCRGITTTADSDLAYHYVIRCAARSAGSGLLIINCYHIQILCTIALRCMMIFRGCQH